MKLVETATVDRHYRGALVYLNGQAFGLPESCAQALDLLARGRATTEIDPSALAALTEAGLVLPSPEDTSWLASARWVNDRVFCDPGLYHRVFSYDIAQEMDVLCDILGPSRHPILIPACGTGRYSESLSKRGYLVEASDISPSMVEFARATHEGTNVSYRVLDMSSHLDYADSGFGGGCLMCNSFRYMLTVDGARTHLEEVRRVLAPGARYVIDLGLNLGPQSVGVPAEWSVEDGAGLVTACWTIDQLEPTLAIDRVQITDRPRDGEASILVEFQPQRVWQLAELAVLISEAGFSLDGVLDRSGAHISSAHWDDELRAYLVLTANT